MESVSDILAVAIGMVFIYLLFSMATTFVVEWIAGLFQLRGRNLANAIMLLLNPNTLKLEGKKQFDQVWDSWEPILKRNAVPDTRSPLNISIEAKLNENILHAFYVHPFITSLSQPGKLPSYISSQNFSAALLDLVSRASTLNLPPVETINQTADVYFQKIKDGISCLPDDALKEALLTFVNNAEVTEETTVNRINALNTSIQNWFNATMDRASGWYKRRTQWIALSIGLIIALTFNVDTINLYQRLWQDAHFRESINAAGTAYLQRQQQQPENIQAIYRDLNAIPIPLGWVGFSISLQDPAVPGIVIVKLIGLLITGLAISQGSAFWFDILKKLMNIRNGGVNPDEKTTSG